MQQNSKKIMKLICKSLDLPLSVTIRNDGNNFQYKPIFVIHEVVVQKKETISELKYERNDFMQIFHTWSNNSHATHFTAEDRVN